MNVLVLGSGKGSWAMRGQQLGAAIGARVSSAPSRTDFAKADLCILVKRAFEEFATTVQQKGIPFIWDAVDFWRQPEDNHTSVGDAPALAKTYMAGMTPKLIVCATQAMAEDLWGVCLPHHSRLRMTPAHIREQVKVVAYEGTPKYLGSWRPAIEAACDRINAQFVVNPPDLRDADVIVAFRGERWDGPICRRWKSGVKYANALAAGRPILTQPSAAFEELRTPGSIVNDITDVAAALESWLSPARREEALTVCRKRAEEFDLLTVARRYRQILASAMQVAA